MLPLYRNILDQFSEIEPTFDWFNATLLDSQASEVQDALSQGVVQQGGFMLASLTAPNATNNSSGSAPAGTPGGPNTSLAM